MTTPTPVTPAEVEALEALAAEAVLSSKEPARLDDFKPEDFGRPTDDDDDTAAPFVGTAFYPAWCRYIAAALNAMPRLLAALSAPPAPDAALLERVALEGWHGGRYTNDSGEVVIARAIAAAKGAK